VPENAKKTANVKVVHLEPESQKMARARIARLPAAIHAVHEKGKQLLQQQLKAFFDQADDSLFSLADKAASNQEQNIYFDSMREVRVQRRGIEKRFNSSIDDAFANLASNQVQPENTSYGDTLDGEALSLVQNDELEEMVAMESSVTRANSEYAEAVQQISLRLDSLVPVKVYQANNPLGPEVLANAFIDQAKRLDIDIKAKLVLFKLFDRTVMQNLGALYSTVNQLLVEHNVLPSLSVKGTSSTASHGVHNVSQTIQSAATMAVESGAGNTLSHEVVALIQTMLDQQQKPVMGGVVAEVVQLLSMVQKSPSPVTNVNGGINALELIGQLQQQSGSEASIGRSEQEVINLVDMLFNFILEDRNLAVEMKAQISRMQIPMVKVALLDKSFFAKGGHSARRLLNEIATAALGWQPPVGKGKSDPLYQKINEVVVTLLTRFDTDVSIFNDLLADFSSFVAKDRRRAAILERRTLDAEDGKARAEVARTIVAIEIELRTVDRVLPPVVKKLIDGPWSNVLFVNNLKYGSHSDSWMGALKTLEDLVLSTLPPRSAEERKTLIQLVPKLLQRLRSGLDSISFNPFEMSEIFKELENVHLACIRGEGIEIEVAEEAVLPEEEVLDEITEISGDLLADVDAALGIEPETSHSGGASEVSGVTAAPSRQERDQESRQHSDHTPQQNAKTVVTADVAFPPDDAFMLQVNSFVQGAWFEMTDEEGIMARCRLAAVIKPTGKYIFVNRNGMKVAEKAQQELAQLLKQNRLRALDNSMLFDRALETVVSGLRKT